MCSASEAKARDKSDNINILCMLVLRLRLSALVVWMQKYIFRRLHVCLRLSEKLSNQAHNNVYYAHRRITIGKGKFSIDFCAAAPKASRSNPPTRVESSRAEVESVRNANKRLGRNKNDFLSPRLSPCFHNE
jgi:hypothetical protein